MHEHPPPPPPPPLPPPSPPPPPPQSTDINALLTALQEPLEMLPVRNRVGLPAVIADPDSSLTRFALS